MSNIYGQPSYTQAPFMQTQRPGGYTPQQESGYYLRPVASKEEAIAAQIDFSGPGTVMPDPVHGVIYLKRFNRDTGSVDFITFAPWQEPAPPEYATTNDINEMRQTINRLAEEIDRLKKTGKAVKANDAAE